MRIAQVVSSYHPRVGGVEKHVRRLAEGCANVGDTVTVLTHQVGSVPAEESIAGVRVLRFPLTVQPQNYEFSLGLSRYLKAHATDFDVVHAHNYHTLAGHAAISGRLPFVYTPHYHGTGHSRLRAFLHPLYRRVGARLFNFADAVICVSDAERSLVIRDFPDAAHKVVRIPNGTDPIPHLPSDVAVMHLSGPVVLTVGRLERHKNIDLVIDAFRAMASAATLVVVGDGPDRLRLERHAVASEPGWPVTFTGRISDTMLHGLVAQATVLASASDHEAFGLALADGLASGARVVASAIPAHAELAELVGVDGPVALVDPRDTAKFADLLTAFVRAGRVPTISYTLPSWVAVVEATRDLYSQVCMRNHFLDRDTAAGVPGLPVVQHCAKPAPTEPV